MSIPGQIDLLPVSGDEFVMSKLKGSLYLVGALLLFVGFSILSGLLLFISIEDANLILALSDFLFVPPAILFGCLTFTIARSLYPGERLVVGEDRIQLLLGENTVKGELLFHNVAEVKLVRFDSQYWTENTVGFRLNDLSKVPVNWSDITCPLTCKFERWLTRRGHDCDLTVGFGWRNPTEMHSVILRRWEAFQSNGKPCRE